MRRLWLPIVATLCLAGCSDDPSWRTTDITEIMPPLDFALIDDDGEAVTAEAYRGKTTLVYFGYTQCPDVCPITLARLGSVINQLDEDVRDEVQVLFVSVDPGRDTPEVLKRYVGAFGPEFTGLTGEREDIDALTNRYRIAYEYEEPNEHGDYIVNHSSAIFAFDEEGHAQFLARDSHSPQDILGDLRTLILKS